MLNGRQAISLSGVGLQIEGKRILGDITWVVGRGEKWVILGKNGSGKTTLLRLLAGYGFPSHGTLEILGETFGRTDLRQMRKRVGWVHGDLAAEIPPFMSAVEVVLSGARGSLAFYETARRAEKTTAVGHLASMGAERLAARVFRTLSTGERQRVLIARALTAHPEILLLDEPCAGLDPLAREEFLESLSALLQGRGGLTVVAVTHHVEEIVEGFAKVLVLDRGEVVAQGDKTRVMRPGVLSRVYGGKCRLSLRHGRYALGFERSGRGG
jgi:iron complex transport system ATP-binding protein